MTTLNEVLSLAELMAMLIELSPDEIHRIKGIGPCIENDGSQYWDKAKILEAIQTAKKR